MSIKKKIITSAIFALTIFNINSALAKLPNNIDVALKPSLSFISYSENFYGTTSPRNTNSFGYDSIFPKNIIIEKTTAAAPIGFQIFCLQNANECKSKSNTTIDYSFRLMKKLEYVNNKVNLAIAPQNDIGTDKWSLNVNVGDCEDYVLAKRSILTKAGIPASALRIATATTKEGVGHAVLIVRTHKGDFVLDNLTNTIKTWDKIDHSLIAISGANPSKWSVIG